MRGDPIKPPPITPYAHYAMVGMLAIEGISSLMKTAPQAARLIMELIRRLQPGSSGGVVVVSREGMKEILGVSMPTVERALRVLMDDGYVQRVRVGGAHALAINTRVAWVGPRGDIQQAVFDATVIASRSEQDSISLNPPPMRMVPIVNTHEQVIPMEPGESPPSQPGLPGIEPPVGRTGFVDPDTGEIFDRDRPRRAAAPKVAAKKTARVKALPKAAPSPEKFTLKAKRSTSTRSKKA